MNQNNLNVVVLGLWHLGCVTSACCSRYHNVIGFDFNQKVVDDLQQSIPPLFEPELQSKISYGLTDNKLSFTSDLSKISNADVLWVTYDTPVDDNDVSDTNFVLLNLDAVMDYIPINCTVVISSQLPVGTCSQLESKYPNHSFVVIPENLRLGKAIESFEKPERIIVGLRHDDIKSKLYNLLGQFSCNLIFMKPESAEMVKHSINSFLALSITFINEIACICESGGADADEVSIGLKSEPRIGKKAYLKPGGSFAGGTLARDIISLINVKGKNSIPLITSIKSSNDNHKNWVVNKLNSLFDTLEGKRITILGLSYTDNTDTLRRSGAVELYDYFVKCNVDVQVYDPLIKKLPEEYNRIKMIDLLYPSDIIIVYTERPIFKDINWESYNSTVIDVSGFLKFKLKPLNNINYFSVGSK